MDKTNILITSAGRRVSLVRAFKKEVTSLGLNAKVYTTDLVPELSSACHVADASFAVKRVTAPSYVDDLIALCKAEQIALIIPTIDTELQVLAQNLDRFLAAGIRPVISDSTVIDNCRDKRLIHAFFDELNFKRAMDVSPSDPKNYPVFVKPYDGSRSQGIYLLNTIDELTAEIKNNPKNLFLEYVDTSSFDEFTVDIYFNRNSKIISVVPRERIFVRDGEVNKGCTRKNSIVSFVLDKMDGKAGFRGCITLQVFLHREEGTVIGIEINPRFGGGFPLTYEAGANFPGWILSEYLLDQSVDSYDDSWEDNLLMLRYDDEVLVSNYKNK